MGSSSQNRGFLHLGPFSWREPAGEIPSEEVAAATNESKDPWWFLHPHALRIIETFYWADSLIQNAGFPQSCG